MIRLLILASLSLPAAAQTAAHSGVVTARTGPEPSDIALFALAAVGVWLVRRAMRRRFRKGPAQD